MIQVCGLTGIKTVLTCDKNGNVVSREVIGPQDGVVRIPDEMLPTIAAIICSSREQKRGA